MALAFDVTVRNAMLDAITTQIGSNALLRFYDGARPATGGAATTLLAELTCNATFAPSAAGGVLTLNVITSDASANNSGTATWFRILTSGAVFKVDGNVGTSGSDLNMDSVTFVSGSTIAVSSFTITAGNP